MPARAAPAPFRNHEPAYPTPTPTWCALRIGLAFVPAVLFPLLGLWHTCHRRRLSTAYERLARRPVTLSYK